MPPKRGRLSRSAEFERVYRQGRSHGNRHLVLYTFPRGGADAAAHGQAEARTAVRVPIGAREDMQHEVAVRGGAAAAVHPVELGGARQPPPARAAPGRIGH